VNKINKSVMKNNILVILIIVFTSGVFAQDESKDLKAKEILSQVSSKYRMYSTIKADIRLIIEDNLEGTTDTQKVSVWMKAVKYKISIPEVETTCDGKIVWSYQKKSNEVTISEKDPADNSFFSNPSMIFSNYETNFKCLYQGEKKSGSATICEIDLFPASLDKDVIQKGINKTGYSRIRLRIDKASYSIRSLTYFGKDGNNFIIEIRKLVPDTELPDTFFTFDIKKHPGIEVIDLRE